MSSLRRLVWLSLFAVLALTVSVLGAEPEEYDPFAPENFVDYKKPEPPKGRGKEPATAKLIDFDVSLSSPDVRRGQVVTLTITGTPKPGYHTYPITQKSADSAQPAGQLSKLTITEQPGIKVLWPITETKPEWVVEKGLGVLLEHEKPFTWSQDILVLPDAQPGVKTLTVRLAIQVCNAQICTVGTHEWEQHVNVTNDAALPLSDALQMRMDTPKPPIQVLNPPAELQAQVKKPTAQDILNDAAKPAPEDHSLLGLLIASSLAAIGMLFTPCVFPMIPITVTFFIKQAEKKHHNPLMTAGVYSLTIIVVLATAVLLLGSVIIAIANNAWLNLGLGLLLVFFALSLFGMYEIELPSSLARFTQSRERQGGLLGAFFMALTFTITSFTCTGPFLGPLLVAAKESAVDMTQLVLAAVVYSATFAAPFFVLALFPWLLKSLPKSGSWLNSVKVVMGFLELAAALKFLANADLTLNGGNAWLFNYETVLCAWIALSVACGLYLIGAYRLPHDTPLEHIGVGRLILASTFFGLAIYMTPALWRVTPMGLVGKGIIAFLPLDTRPAELTASRGDQKHLSWQRDYETAWEQARKEGKLLFIDFTGVTCTNCRANEVGVFPLPPVRRELEKFVRVQLYTDSVPDSSLSAEERERQGSRNQGWQAATFGELSNPLYVIMKPEGEKPVEDGKLQGEVLGRYAGYINNPDDFVKFLQSPEKKQMAQAKLGD